MKKITISLLTLALLATGLLGCSGKPKPSGVPTPAPTYSPTDKIEVSVALWDMQPAQQGTPSAELQKLIEDKFGITLVPFQVTRENFKTKLQEAVAANALPDAFSFLAFGDRPFFKQLLDQKSIRDLPESITKPYTALTVVLNRYRSSEGVDGKLYFLPRTNLLYNYRSGQSSVIFYRADWGRESGKVKVGEALDWRGFFDLMAYFTHGDPNRDKLDNTYALSTSGADGLDTVFMMTYGVRQWVLEGGKWVPGVFSARAREALKWANEACRNGLIDPASLQQDEQAMIDKFCTGKTGMIVLDGSPQSAGKLAAEWARQQPDIAITKAVAVLSQPVNPYGVAYNEDTSYGSGTAFSAAVDDIKLKRMLPLFDWLYTADGLTAAKFGKLNVDYSMQNGVPVTKRKDAQGNPVLFSQQNTQWAPVGTLSTLAQDFIPEAGEDSFEGRCLQAMQDHWWINNWRTSLFTGRMLSDAVMSFDDTKARDKLAEMMFQSSDIDRDWDAYVSALTGSLNVAQAQQEVNDYAAKQGIKQEE